ncbi:glyoxalase I [Stereum hirsutum FP-91666 SS1]|uniref:glyoxalase I n=1 Tax=Stereum hirsutum (strain FP-91666) TaxID=721885 RepID=UPI000444A7F7|nr:glyoxalase I [Stereum hirsutum FP-91666 SS1]EIM81203.1 glyoxalase I [Stereum hirsutum FP-91666 SS1]
MPRTAETAGFRLNHTMLRIKDPKVSLAFYTDVIGMDFVSAHDGPDFTNYFLTFDHSGGKLTAEEKEEDRLNREGVLELCHNHGTESLESTPYHNGNKEPRGFGHIAITVDDVNAACERFEKLGVPFQKKLSDGRMKHIAFILDPDGYWIEVLQNNKAKAKTD